jgi:hypothetical protein
MKSEGSSTNILCVYLVFSLSTVSHLIQSSPFSIWFNQLYYGNNIGRIIQILMFFVIELYLVIAILRYDPAEGTVYEVSKEMRVTKPFRC